MLEAKRIEELSSLPNVKSVAVTNFLSTANANPTYEDAVDNAYNDARSYGWNDDTLNAILDGLDEAFDRDVWEDEEEYYNDDDYDEICLYNRGMIEWDDLSFSAQKILKDEHLEDNYPHDAA
jgi:hypothetical protein